MDHRSDEELLTAYRSGETAAFEMLVRRHHDDLLRFLFRLMGSAAAAEDVFQETFLQVHLAADTFDATRRFKPWLFTIAANKARDSLRKSSRRRMLDLSAPIGKGSGGSGSGGYGGASSGGGGGGGGGEDGRSFIDLMEIDVPPPSSNAEAADRNRLVQLAIDGLPFSLREILLLAYFQRLSYSQIADALDIPLGTVKSRLHAAVAAFAKRWDTVSKGSKDV